MLAPEISSSNEKGETIRFKVFTVSGGGVVNLCHVAQNSGGYSHGSYGDLVVWAGYYMFYGTKMIVAQALVGDRVSPVTW